MKIFYFEILNLKKMDKCIKLYRTGADWNTKWNGSEGRVVNEGKKM